MKATDIPASSRSAVHERDRGHCRGCGQTAWRPELHHIVFRSQARNHHEPSNLVTLCYGCHRLAHTRSQLMREAFQAVVETPAITAFRWLRSRGVDLRALRGGTL